MAEFLQSYGTWILFGLLFPLMLWGHFRGRGVGCCGGHQPAPEAPKQEEPQSSENNGSSCH